MSSTQIEQLITQNSKGLPEEILQEILDFIQFLKFKKNGSLSNSINLSEYHLNTAESDCKREFEYYKEIWQRETLLSSSTTEMINHSAYQHIISLGKDVVPLLLRDMLQKNNHWFEALHKITGEDPVPKEHWGKIQQMIQDWIQWAKDKNIDF